MSVVNGVLRVELPAGRVDLPVTSVRFRDGAMFVTGTVEVSPGEPDLVMPAGRWPVALVGDDGEHILTSWAQIERDTTASNREPGSQPVSFHLVAGWKLDESSQIVSYGE